MSEQMDNVTDDVTNEELQDLDESQLDAASASHDDADDDAADDTDGDSAYADEQPEAKPERKVVIVGVDGGGTKTRVIVADMKGKTLARAEGSGSAVRQGHEDEAAETIAQTIDIAMQKANRADARISVCVVGVAGGGQERAQQALWSALARRRIADDIVVQADATSAIDDAFGDGPGVMVISGTGSAAFGRAPDGRLERCGGWGPPFGDEGSGAWLGRRALGVVAAAYDGREPETALLGAILTATECESPEQLIKWAVDATPAKFATLVPVISQVAASGDLRANALVSICVEELVLHVRTLARKCFGDERAAIPVALHGGVMARGNLIRKRLEQRLKSAVPGAMVRAEEVDGTRGAVRKAQRMIGVE
ncbi:MAG: N-acetylglucosamine kinase [Gemmatimonas sp.]